MKILELGKEKIKKICDELRDEILEPAQKEAREIIEKAKQQADEMITQAYKETERLHLNAKTAIEQDILAFHSSLRQAAKQGLEMLRQSIESTFFDEHLSTLIEKEMENPRLIADLINAIVKALEKEGLAVDLAVLVPKMISVRQLNEFLLREVLSSLDNHSVATGDFNAGVRLKVQNKKMTIDISEDALKELLGTNIFRKDFRKMIFNQD